jgi:ABC-2 type transport system permease protein
MGNIVAATVPFVGFAWAAAAVAWTVGCATGAPGAASGAGWAFIAVSFLANSFGEVITELSWLTDVSPWGWYGAGEPVTDGFDPMGLLLFALALLLVPLGVRLFAGRDLQL